MADHEKCVQLSVRDLEMLRSALYNGYEGFTFSAQYKRVAAELDRAIEAHKKGAK